MLAMIALGLADSVFRWYVSGPEGLTWLAARAALGGARPMASRAGRGAGGGRSLPYLPAVAIDPRLASLRHVAETWERRSGPRRLVVDQVCLVPDVPSFLEAIASWDDRHFFPILIDEPAWTLPFLRAFRPSRVVRHATRGHGRTSSIPGSSGPSPQADRLERWMAAVGAVARGWSPPSRGDDELPLGGAPPRGLDATPPGLVLSSPDSPMLAGAVALAAGRFQPLVRLEPGLWGLDAWGGERSVRYADVLTLEQAWRFARRLEGQVASVTPRYDRLGDDCDFLTIAGDWPYRYDDRAEGAPARGIHALDDLVGRSLVGEPDARGLNDSRRRWAFAGRLLGDPAASVARAMGALFLAPDAALLWDTYDSRDARSEYTVAPAVGFLGQSGLIRSAVVYGAGPGSSLASWAQVMDPRNRFGLIWMNSTGGPSDFSIAGGPGRPADVPGGYPAAVLMVQSNSAADPADPRTIAGRWLAQGAYVYFGSVNEPFLQAFRKPGLVADLAIRGVPLSAALRQGESEPFGRPWRLIFLGDPLYRLSQGGRPERRLRPEAWRKLDAAYADWPAEDIAVPAEIPAPGNGKPVADRRLRWCREAAIAELAQGSRAAPRRPGPDWRSALKEVPREQLDPRLRRTYDELLIDALSGSGEWDELHARLSKVPPPECGPRVWAALETGAMFRLARAAREPSPERRRARINGLGDEVMRLAWPAGSPFPRQFAARLAAALQELARPRSGDARRP
jgi:hypothetical protein